MPRASLKDFRVKERGESGKRAREGGEVCEEKSIDTKHYTSTIRERQWLTVGSYIVARVRVGVCVHL